MKLEKIIEIIVKGFFGIIIATVVGVRLYRAFGPKKEEPRLKISWSNNNPQEILQEFDKGNKEKQAKDEVQQKAAEEKKKEKERENYLFEVKNSIKFTLIQTTSPDYDGNSSLYINFVNVSDKTIKYVYWSGIMRNAVGDPIRCEKTGDKGKKGRIVGPYEPGEGPSAAVCYPNFFNNFESDLFVFDKVDIYYMDGSRLYVKGDDIVYLLKE